MHLVLVARRVPGGTLRNSSGTIVPVDEVFADRWWPPPRLMMSNRNQRQRRAGRLQFNNVRKRSLCGVVVIATLLQGSSGAYVWQDDDDAAPITHDQLHSTHGCDPYCAAWAKDDKQVACTSAQCSSCGNREGCPRPMQPPPPPSSAHPPPPPPPPPPSPPLQAWLVTPQPTVAVEELEAAAAAVLEAAALEAENAALKQQMSEAASAAEAESQAVADATKAKLRAEERLQEAAAAAAGLAASLEARTEQSVEQLELSALEAREVSALAVLALAFVLATLCLCALFSLGRRCATSATEREAAALQAEDVTLKQQAFSPGFRVMATVPEHHALMLPASELAPWEAPVAHGGGHYGYDDQEQLDDQDQATDVYEGSVAGCSSALWSSAASSTAWSANSAAPLFPQRARACKMPVPEGWEAASEC